MREDILQMLTAVDLASIVLGWVIIMAAIVAAVSFGDKR